MELVSVSAVAANGVIGDGDSVPWDLPEDVRQYRARVADSPVVMGRRTYEMFATPPGTAQVVLSRTERDWDADTAHHAGGVDEAVAVTESLDADRAYVIGGAAVYALFLPRLDRMVLTRVPDAYEGDAHYPEWDDAEWDLADTDEYDSFTVETWVRNGKSGPP